MKIDETTYKALNSILEIANKELNGELKESALTFLNEVIYKYETGNDSAELSFEENNIREKIRALIEEYFENPSFQNVKRNIIEYSIDDVLDDIFALSTYKELSVLLKDITNVLVEKKNMNVYFTGLIGHRTISDIFGFIEHNLTESIENLE